MDTRLLTEIRAAQADDESGLYRFYEQLLTRQGQYEAGLSAPPFVKEGEVVEVNLPLEWEMLGVEPVAFEAWLREIGQVWQAMDAAAPDELEVLGNAEEAIAAARQWYKTGESGNGPTVDALVANTLLPYLHKAVAQVPPIEADEWQAAECPYCGGWPDFARYDERRERYDLICERCQGQWRIEHEGCLFCGEDDSDQRGYFSSEDDIYRVLLCDTCGTYIKTINAPAARRAKLNLYLPAERFLTPGLDVMAIQEGYERPANQIEN